MASGGFLSNLAPLAAGVAQSGSSIFRGLAEAQQVRREEEDRQLQRERQSMLDRLRIEHEARQAEQFQQNQARLLEYIRLREGRQDRPSALGSTHMTVPKPGGGWDIVPLPSANPPKIPALSAKDERMYHGWRAITGEPDTDEAFYKFQQETQKPPPATPTYIHGEGGNVTGVVPRPGGGFEQSPLGVIGKVEKPSESDKAISDYLAAHGQPDTAANRDKAREAIATRAAGIKNAAGEDKPLGAGAAHWANAQGQHPSPLMGMREAVEKKYFPFQGKVPPEVASRITIGAVDQVLSMIPPLKNKSLLMSKPGWWQYAWTSFQRGAWQKGDDDLTAFISHTSTLVRTARELGDIGFRAQAAIRGTTDLVEKAQTAGGVEKALRQLRNLLELAAPATVPRKLRVFDTQQNEYLDVTFAPGETLDMLPMHMDPNR